VSTDTPTSDTPTSAPASETSPIVQVRDLTRDYSQGDLTVRALRGVDLDIRTGEFTALMGPSGSGKTTLLNLIGGLDAPTSGSVVVDGRDLSTMSAAEVSRTRLDRIGFVFQAYNLIPVLSAYENAEFVLMMQGVPPAERKERVMSTLAAVGLTGMEHRRPNELSGGQQQRVAVARAIAGRPALVLADEPTANLDSKTGHELVDLMRKLNEDRGVTFVFATHDPKVMQGARRIVQLVDGNIVADETK
jgi:putative ABC transport system ATP-binding protein